MTKDRRRLDLSVPVSPICDSDGQLIGASKIAQAITDLKMAVQALALQSERLTRAKAELGQFAYVTSHDLMEPIRTLSTCIEVFLNKAAAEKRKSIAGSRHHPAPRRARM